MFKLFPVLLITFTILATASVIIAVCMKQKLYLIGLAVFLAGDFIVIVLYIIMPVITFFAGGFFGLERFGFNRNGNNYHFTVHEYNYKTADIGNRSYNHTDNLVIENLCKVNYGFFCDPATKQAKDNGGNLIARRGLPFTFSVKCTELNHDIETIRFTSAKIIFNDNSTIDMFNLDAIDYAAWYTVSDYSIWYTVSASEETDTKRPELDNKELRLQFKNKKELDFNGLKQRVVEKIEQSSEEDKIKRPNEASMACTVEFKPITFDVIQHEEIAVKIEIEIVTANGEIENIVLDNIYKREYYSYDDAWPRPLEELDKEEGYKL